MSFTPAEKRPADPEYNAVLRAILDVVREGTAVNGGVDDNGRRWLKVTFPLREETP